MIYLHKRGSSRVERNLCHSLSTVLDILNSASAADSYSGKNLAGEDEVQKP